MTTRKTETAVEEVTAPATAEVEIEETTKPTFRVKFNKKYEMWDGLVDTKVVSRAHTVLAVARTLIKRYDADFIDCPKKQFKKVLEAKRVFKEEMAEATE